jgi:hypothetical protein
MYCRLPLAACSFLTFAASDAAHAQSETRLRARFGVTEYLPLRTPRTKASDYVADAERAVPAAVERCGGRHVVYIRGTDGGAAAEFSTSRQPAGIRACMAEALPQVEIEPAAPRD